VKQFFAIIESEASSSWPQQPIGACPQLIHIPLKYFPNKHFNVICQSFSRNTAEIVGVAVISIRKVTGSNLAHVTGYPDFVLFWISPVSPSNGEHHLQ
jgi:hypothetical protein